MDKAVCVTPSLDDVHEGAREWKNSLIVQFVCQIANFSTFQRMLKYQWGKEGEFTVRPAGSNIFVARMASVEARDRILEVWYEFNH